MLSKNTGFNFKTELSNIAQLISLHIQTGCVTFLGSPKLLLHLKKYKSNFQINTLIKKLLE